MFLRFENTTTHQVPFYFDTDDVYYYQIDSSGTVTVQHVGGSGFANGSANKDKFLKAMQGKKLLVLDNTSTDYYLVVDKIGYAEYYDAPGESYDQMLGISFGSGISLNPTNADDKAAFLAYMDGISK